MKLSKLGVKSCLKTQKQPQPLSHPTEGAATTVQTIWPSYTLHNSIRPMMSPPSSFKNQVFLLQDAYPKDNIRHDLEQKIQDAIEQCHLKAKVCNELRTSTSQRRRRSKSFCWSSCPATYRSWSVRQLSGKYTRCSIFQPPKLNLYQLYPSAWDKLSWMQRTEQLASTFAPQIQSSFI